MKKTSPFMPMAYIDKVLRILFPHRAKMKLKDEREEECRRLQEQFMAALSSDRGFLCSPELFAPRFGEATTTTDFSPDYTYHCAWAARKVLALSPDEHVDIGSYLYFVVVLSAAIPVRFYDFRPLEITLSNFQSDFADITALPFPDNSVSTISSLSVIEHIGLGRYGDPLDPDGDVKAIRELIRVTKPGGAILVNLPVAQKPCIMFNAHRIYTRGQVLNLFANCELKEFFAAVRTESDEIVRLVNPDSDVLLPQKIGEYAGGCFYFEKK